MVSCHGGNGQPPRTSHWRQPVVPLAPRSSCYDPVPMPPIWVNEDGQRVQTRPCPWLGCGREVPIRRYSHQILRLIGWPLYRVASVVQWCGHRQEFILVPDEGEWVQMVPTIRTTK
jgi:hypothetical protein